MIKNDWYTELPWHFLTLPIVQTLLPVTFGYFLSSRKNSEAVVMRQLRRWKRLWRRWLTRSHKRISLGPARSCWNGTSALQPGRLLRRVVEFHVCTINKSAHSKKSLETYLVSCISLSATNFGIKQLKIFDMLKNIKTKIVYRSICGCISTVKWK